MLHIEVFIIANIYSAVQKKRKSLATLISFLILHQKQKIKKQIKAF